MQFHFKNWVTTKIFVQGSKLKVCISGNIINKIHLENLVGDTTTKKAQKKTNTESW